MSFRLTAILAPITVTALVSTGCLAQELATSAGSSSTRSAADLDASLQEALAAAGMPNPLRSDRQRQIDPRLVKIEAVGIEASGLFPGKVHRAESPEQVRAFSEKLRPGDQLVLAGSEWRDARLVFCGHGTADAPILVRPEEPDGIILRGASTAVFYGEHLIVMGLKFKDGTITRPGTVVFRLGNGEDKPAANCIVNRVAIENCNAPRPEDWPRTRTFYMTVCGPDNTVANSTFADLDNFGQMLSAQRLPENELLRLHVLNNRFLNRPKLDDQNGYEIIQIGWSGERARPAGCLIQGNLFRDCDGENETITLKASDVFFRRNTFSGCQGVLNFRKADRVLVQDNLFDGRGRANTGGVRVEGADHVIIENTFRNLKQPQNYYYWPISLMSGSSEDTTDDPVSYGRVQNVLIARNRFEHNDQTIAVGTYPRPDYPLLPRNIHIERNTFVGMPGKTAVDYTAPDPTGALSGDLHENDNRFLP